MIFRLIERLNSIKKFPFYIITPTIYAIGNASEQINLSANYAYKRKKILIILKINIFPKLLKYSVCNNALFDELEIKNNYYIKLLFQSLVNLEFFFKRSYFLIKKYFKNKFKDEFIFPTIGINEVYGFKKINLNTTVYQDIKSFSFNNDLLNFDKEKEEYCKKKINKLGINDNDKIVCIHVRDGKYRDDSNRKSYRNSDINNYLESIKFLISSRYKVIRMGKNSNTKIFLKNENFIDYNFNEIQEDILDLYLIKKCQFYIGTQSGILDVAHMFNKPILLTNMCELYTSFPRKKIDRGIFKKICNKYSGENISINEFAKMPFKYHDPQLEINDLVFYENNSHELLECTKEFLVNLQNKLGETILQNKFNNLIKKQYETFYNQRLSNQHNLKIQVDSLKMIRMFKSIQGSLCDIYLRNNSKF
tara:strand:+ start:828 stop:2087 length:1260 start_codon:yes stop_codon:yes gene_type:complete